MPKNKPNKGLLKRVRVTKSGKVKLSRAFGRHLRSHKSGKLVRSYRKAKYAVPAEVKRIRNLLPSGVKVSSARRSCTAAETEES
ncbi:MAG: 50S ribosomal protein L35 [Phycisphaerales bacterium]|nr:MAG: 50S ribosomal protein L35 [Phycisphaerales bacterium]